jgi:hypothetical protein
MEQGGFGGRYETVMSSGGRAAELRDFGRPMSVSGYPQASAYAVITSASLNSGHWLGRAV